MFLWRKRADPEWWAVHEKDLLARAGRKLVVIEWPNRKRLGLEIACPRRRNANEFLSSFGGSIEKLPGDWLKRFSREQEHEPIRIGNRLLITNAGGGVAPRPPRLVIPAGAAFGTGRHVTTAMSLRLLEELTRGWTSNWTMVDLGTGSGVLALAAIRLGARRAIGIDNDPIAISTAKQNARRNRVDEVIFNLADVRSWRVPGGKVDVITANLFSELLINVLPRYRRPAWLIVSGVLREQEKELVQALKRAKIEPLQIRRRGNWIALLGRRIDPMSSRT